MLSAAFLTAISLILVLIGGDVKSLCATIFYFLLFTSPGHCLVFPLYYRNGRFMEGFVWGSISGLAISSFTTSIIVYLIGWNLHVVLSGLSICAVTFCLFLWKGRVQAIGRVINDTPHIQLFLIALSMVTIFFYLPYKNTGILEGNRYLYAWLFGHDFLNRIVHIESLSRGIPMKGMFFSGETLSYYWLSYIFPAFIHNIKEVQLEIKQLLQLTQLYYSLLTTVAIILFLKKYVHEKNILIIGVVLAFCCYSYVWVLRVGKYVLDYYYPFSANNAFSNFSGFSHGLYRFFLVEPQGTFAIALTLMIFNLHGTGATAYGFCLIGLLVGLLFGAEATNGIMVMLWFDGMGLYYIIIHRQNRFQMVIKHLVASLCLLAVCGTFFTIEMYSFSIGKRALQLSINWFALKTNFVYLTLAYGPSMILGIAGIYVLIKKRATYDHWVYSYVMLLGINLFFVFFIQNPTEYHFGLLKATRIIPICLLMITVYFLKDRLGRAKLGKGLALLIALATPSLITDNIIASDIKNPSTFVRHADLEAARWIKENLPKNAIVQAEPNYPGVDDKGMWPKYAYSFIPIFAERMTAVGEWKVSSQEHGKPEEVAGRFWEIERMYEVPNLDECLKILKAYNIGYIYIGELEKEKHVNGMKKFGNNQVFKPVYIKENTSVYEVVK